MERILTEYRDIDYRANLEKLGEIRATTSTRGNISLRHLTIVVKHQAVNTPLLPNRTTSYMYDPQGWCQPPHSAGTSVDHALRARPF